MIPFARIISYGNKVIAPVVKDFKARVGTHYFVLYEDGSLYGRGSQIGYLFGDGINHSTAITEWYKIRDDVDSFTISPNFLFVKTKSGDYFISAGRATSVFFGSGLSNANTWVNCNSVMALSPGGYPFKAVYSTSTSSPDALFCIDENNDLYSTGFTNSNYITGTGTTTAKGLTKILANVKYVSIPGDVAAWAITNDNRLYRWGGNATRLLANGTGTNTLNVPTEYVNASGVKFTDVFVKTSMVYLRATDGSLWVNGAMTTGQAGGGVATATYGTPTQIAGVTFNQVFDAPPQNAAGTFMLQGSTIKYAGNSAQYGGIGSSAGTNVLTWTAVVGIPTIDFSKPLSAISGPSNSMIFANGKLYGTGYVPNLFGYVNPGGGQYVYTFVELELPQ